MANVRLAAGPGRCAGRLEVADRSGVWGTVCSDGFSSREAGVVCRMLGCPRSGRALGNAHFGAGTGHIFLDDVRCIGSEGHIFNCRNSGWGRHNCNHRKDVSVVCS